jgi:two-component system, NarL family, response regulator LiaR
LKDKIRVLICDDQTIVCEGIRAILSTAAEIEVVGVAYNGAEALALIPSVHPNLVLMDLKMPEMNGIQATRAIRERYHDIHVLVLTTYDADEWVIDAIRGGAQGYLLKDTPREELIQAIVDTVNGLVHLDPQVAGKIIDQVARQPVSTAPDRSMIDRLSQREREVLRLLARGMNNTEIAQILYLSDGTIKNYVSIILDKLGVTDRTQAAILAIRAGLNGMEEN